MIKLDSSFEKIKTNIAGFFTEWFEKRRHRVEAILFAVMLVIYIVMGIVSKNLIARMPDQLEAGRWSDEMRMAQVSVFVTQDQMVTEDDMRRFYYTFEQKLRDAGVKDPDEDEDGAAARKNTPQIIDTLGIDEMMSDEEYFAVPEKTGFQKLIAMAYSAQGMATVSFENRTVDTASVIGVAGDFFIFHPMILASGGYFSGDDLMKDHVVLDEEMAWQLFGSTDIVGQIVTVGGVPHYVAGVVKKDQGRIEKAGGLDGCFVYMSLESLARYGDSILSGRNESKEIAEDNTSARSGGINCIEVVCPNPVNGLAAKLAGESIGLPEGSYIVIDNTDRFSGFNLFKVLRSYGTRSMWGKAIYYPYWENIARGYEDMLATLFLFRVIALLTMAIIVAITAVDLYRNKKWTVREVANYLSDKKYDLEVAYNQKKQQKNVVNAAEEGGGEE